MSGTAPAGYDEEVSPPPAPAGYDEEVAPPAGVEMTSTGIAAPQGVAPSMTGPDSVAGGFLRRGVQAVRGVGQTFGPPQPDENALTSLPVSRIARGWYDTAKQAYGQAQDQYGQAVENAKQGDIVGSALRYGQAVTTGLSMLDPFATGPVTNINKLSSEGRYKEALGQGGFDALTMLAGKKAGSEPATATKLNKLAYATDAQSMAPLTRVLPDLEETVKRSGPPQTVGDLLKTVQDTSDRLDTKFNTALQGMGTQPIHVQDIADALKNKANDLPRSAAAEAQELRNAARLYDGQVTTARELNADRMYRNANLKGFYNQGMTGQMAAMRSNAQTMVDEIVADKARDVLYGEMDKRFPSQDFQGLKMKQSSLLDILDRFGDHVEKLEAGQAKKSGEPAFTKAPVSASVHNGGITARMYGLIPGRSPLSAANSATASAFEPTAAASARRAAILSLPLGTLTGQRPPTIPPPPQQ